MARTKKTEAAAAEVVDVQIAPADGTFAYTVVWSVKADGRRYEPGETIQLDAATAARMIESGAIRAAATE